jgi:phage-related holin
VKILKTLSSYSIVGAFGGGIQALFSFLYGGGEVRLAIFLIYLFVLVVDYIAGTSAAEKDGSYGSVYGRKGALKILFVYSLIPAVANLGDVALNVKEPFVIYGYQIEGLVFGTVTFMMGRHVLKSAIANAYRAGWNIPEAWAKWAKNEIELKEARATERRLEKQRLLKLKEGENANDYVNH